MQSLFSRYGTINPNFSSPAKDGQKKSGIKIILAFLVIPILVLGGCDLSMRRYNNQEHGFSILLPRGWEQEEGFKGTVLLARAKEKNPKFQTNINVNAGNLAETERRLNRKISFAEFYEVNKAELMQVLPGIKYNIQEGEIFTKSGKAATLSFDNNIEGLRIKFLIGIWMKEGRVYIVTCSTETEKFIKYLPIFKKSLRSLRIRSTNLK